MSPLPFIDEALLRRIRRRLKHAHTVEQLTEAFGISRSTLYRYLKILEERGFRVSRVGIGRPTQYKVLKSYHD